MKRIGVHGRVEERDAGTGELRRSVRPPHRRLLLGVGGFAAVCFCLAGQAAGGGSSIPTRQVDDGPRVRIVKGLRVTSVEGDSWLRHLGSSFIASNMGRAGPWALSPSNAATQLPNRESSKDDFVLSGADLYRLSCQSCHTAAGSGVVPEINSLIGPVQATSAVMIRAQMKQRGLDLDAKTTAKLVSQATAALHARLQKGGERMPPFGHLASEEVEALLPYLDALAGVPGAQNRQIWLSEPAERVGELLVKGTCHICHEAVGPGLGIAVASQESIPPLASLPASRSRSEVIRKVCLGISKPTPMMTSSHGQMPVFSELTPAEVAAAYDYLVRFPPRP